MPIKIPYRISSIPTHNQIVQIGNVSAIANSCLLYPDDKILITQ